MPFDEINYPADRPSGVAPATSTATSVWLATYGSGWPGDERGLQRVFATKEEAYAYAARPERSRHEDCHIEEWALGGDCLSHVATSHVPRHDEPTCCGERQKADVGEGWRMLGPDEYTQKGDEVKNIWGCWQAVEGVFLGRAGFRLPHRRRVTPVPEAPQLSHSAVSAMCERNERAALLKKIDTLKAESTQQQEKILHAFLEAERLTAELERLRLRPEEIACINEFADELSNNLPVTAMVVRDVIKRLGGGE